MKRLVIYFSALLIGESLCSCAQSPVPSNVAVVASHFAADKVPANLAKYSQATFAAGCFWHEETLFESVKGVVAAVSGYAGGTARNPTYEEVASGATGHAETVNVYYDSTKISYADLLKVYFEGQEDPTQVNGQGPDEGTEYRSILFYRNAKEKAMATQYIQKMNQSGKFKKPVATELKPYTVFWKAEQYHQRYIDHNTDNPYVQNVSIKAIAHFQARYPGMIKPGHSFAAK